MFSNFSIDERNAIYLFPPATANNAAVSSDYFPVTDAERISVIVGVGATDADVVVKVEQAVDAAGTGVKDVAGATATITATDDNGYVVIDVKPEKFDGENGYTYGRITATVAAGTNGADLAGVIIMPARHNPPTQPASLVQAVQVY